MKVGVRVDLILHLLFPVDFISNMWFRTKLSNKCRVGSKITKENCHDNCSLSFLKSEYVLFCQVFLAVVLCRWLYSKIQMYKHPVHALLSLSEHSPSRWYGFPGRNDVSMVWAGKSKNSNSDSKIMVSHWKTAGKVKRNAMFHTFDSFICLNRVCYGTVTLNTLNVRECPCFWKGWKSTLQKGEISF